MSLIENAVRSFFHLDPPEEPEAAEPAAVCGGVDRSPRGGPGVGAVGVTPYDLGHKAVPRFDRTSADGSTVSLRWRAGPDEGVAVRYTPPGSTRGGAQDVSLCLSLRGVTMAAGADGAERPLGLRDASLAREALARMRASLDGAQLGADPAKGPVSDHDLGDAADLLGHISQNLDRALAPFDGVIWHAPEGRLVADTYRALVEGKLDRASAEKARADLEAAAASVGRRKPLQAEEVAMVQGAIAATSSDLAALIEGSPVV